MTKRTQPIDPWEDLDRAMRDKVDVAQRLPGERTTQELAEAWGCTPAAAAHRARSANLNGRTVQDGRRTVRYWRADPL